MSGGLSLLVGREFIVMKPEPNTQLQKDVLLYIIKYIELFHHAPNARMIAERFKWRSKTAATDKLAELEKQGFLEKNGSKYSLSSYFTVSVDYADSETIANNSLTKVL